MRSSTIIVKASLTIIDNNPSQDCDETKLLTVIPKFKQFTRQYRGLDTSMILYNPLNTF